MKKKLIVISVDSMVFEDINILRGLKNFNRILSDSSIVEHNLSTYPTLTHAVHSSIYTGCWPIHHSIPGNEQYIPGGEKLPWYEHYAWLRRKGLGEIAEEQGYKTALIYWPLTIGAPDTWVLHRSSIHYQIENELDVIRERSTPGLVDELLPLTKDTFTGKWEDHYTQSDFRSCISMAYLIDRYEPDVMYMHLINIDHVRHKKGVYGDHIKEAYEILDKDLDCVFEALEKKNLLDNTIFAFTADHGQIDIDRVVSINRFLRDNGFLTTDKDDNLLTWQAIAHAESMQAQIIVRDHDPEVKERVYKLLADNREMLGIGEIMTAEYAREHYHTTGDPDFFCDTDGHSTFTSKIMDNLYSSINDEDYRYSRATHGYLPDKGPQPLFFVRNPFNNKRAIVENARVIDQMPTLAKMMDISIPEVDGRVIGELC